MAQFKFENWVQMNEKERLKLAIENSPYSSKQWDEAMKTFEGWMQKQSRTCDFTHMLGYLECTAEYAKSSGPLVEFSEFLLQLLEDAGYDGP